MPPANRPSQAATLAEFERLLDAFFCVARDYERWIHRGNPTVGLYPDQRHLDETRAAVVEAYREQVEIVAAADRMRLGDDDCLRCPWCRWPIRESVDLGCTPGNCSQRPLPNDTAATRALGAYDQARAARDGEGS